MILQPTALIVGICKEFLSFHLIDTVWALIFTFIAAWNEFVAALTLTTSSAVTPLTVRLDMFIGQYTADWRHLFGASVVATIPVLILFALLGRQIVSGLTAGSVKERARTRFVTSAVHRPCAWAGGSARRTSAELAVPGAAGGPAAGCHLHDHPPAAQPAVARRLQLAGAGAGRVLAVARRPPAAVAVGGGHRSFARALIGIFSSRSMARSSPAGRPSVVR